MSYISRINHAFKDAPYLPLDMDSKYILFSDCHRGVGNAGDNFLKNQNLYFAALNHYYKSGYHYIELGDGDELWENRCMETIIKIHSNVFWLLSKFYREHRLHMLYGNHDIPKKRPTFGQDTCNSISYNNQHQTPLLPDITFYSGLILENSKNDLKLYLTHGHQADFLNCTLWPIARFLVRYLWKPLELFGFQNPISAAQNNIKKSKTDQRLSHWARARKRTIIAGHTHNPMLPEDEYPYYINTGSCVHPRCITGIEIENMCFTLIKWNLGTRQDRSLYVKREILAGPVSIIQKE